MASYKVVFRDESPKWQPGCPIRVETVQVSRNTETAQCYLQLRIRNVFNSKVSKITLKAVAISPDGKTHEQVIELLDADLEPELELSPKAVELPLKDISNVEVAVAKADGASGWAVPAVIPKPAELPLGEKAAAERNALAREENVHNYVAMHEEHDNWWMCSCGAVNVARTSCYACQVKLKDLSNWENETWLNESADKRAYDDAKRKLASKRAKSVEEAKRGFLALREYADSPMQVVACEEKLKRIAADTKKRNKIIGIAVGAIAIIAIVVALLINLLIPTLKYRDAQKFADDGEYYTAYLTFSELDGFSDSASKMQELVKGHPEAFTFVKSKEIWFDPETGKQSYVIRYGLRADGLTQTVNIQQVESSTATLVSYIYDTDNTTTACTDDFTEIISASEDVQGRIIAVKMEDSSGTLRLKYEYASDGSISKKTSESDLFTYTTTYENGFRTSYVEKYFPSEHDSCNFKYTVNSRNAQGNPTKITRSGTSTYGDADEVYTFEYDEYGNITKEYVNGKLMYENEWTRIAEPADYTKLLSSLKF